MITLDDVARDYVPWSREIFPDASPGSCLVKLGEEIEELFDAVPGDREEEAADVFITLLAFCDRAGIDLAAAAAAKMLVNKARIWRQDADGTVHHIRERA